MKWNCVHVVSFNIFTSNIMMYSMQCFVDLTCIITSCRANAIQKKYWPKNKLGFINKNAKIFIFNIAIKN